MPSALGVNPDDWHAWLMTYDVVYPQRVVHSQHPLAAYPRCGHCAGFFKGGSVTATCPMHPECSIGLLHHNCVRLHMEVCHPDHNTPLGFDVDPLLLAKQGRWEEYYADQTRRFLEAQWSRMTLKIIRR